MPRDFRVYLEDILGASGRIKQLPADLRARDPGIDWQKIAGLRDILIHQYFGIDVDILWDIIQNKSHGLPALVPRLGEGKARARGLAREAGGSSTRPAL